MTVDKFGYSAGMFFCFNSVSFYFGINICLIR